jgi:transcriptional regulator with GAF, ATPase, and Fis domain
MAHHDVSAAVTPSAGKEPIRSTDAISLQMIVEASRTLLSDLRLESVLTRLLDLAREYIPADAYAVWRHCGNEKNWTVLASSGLSESYNRQFEPAGPMIDSIVTVPDVASLPQLVEHRARRYQEEGIRALIIACAQA